MAHKQKLNFFERHANRNFHKASVVIGTRDFSGFKKASTFVNRARNWQTVASFFGASIKPISDFDLLRAYVYVENVHKKFRKQERCLLSELCSPLISGHILYNIGSIDTYEFDLPPNREQITKVNLQIDKLDANYKQDMSNACKSFYDQFIGAYYPC